MLKRVFLIGAVAIISVFVIACGDDDDDTTDDPVDDTAAATSAAAGDGDGDGDGDGQTIPVLATDFAFDVDDISAAPGEEITINLTNGGDAPHTFTIDDIEFEVEAAGGEDASGSFTAPEASADFYCKFHPTQMTGTITISGAANPASDEGDGVSSVGYSY